MNTAIAVITALGVLVAILANLANIARFMGERRDRAAKAAQARTAHDAPHETGTPHAARRLGLAGNHPAPSTEAPQPMGAILTPDQRLRVFVSSTLDELAPERAAVREAIGDLRLTPVMFELGARPYPPADLYRAYLGQSDVFVGIYGERYGWVAPGERVSGLEDEYLLSAGLPTLLYIKEPVTAREERLERLLERIREDGRASYRRFRDPTELAELLSNDLAVLVTERFHAGPPGDGRPGDATVRPLRLDELEPGRLGEVGAAWPALAVDEPRQPLAATTIPQPVTSFVGRQLSTNHLFDLMARPDVRLVTLHGPGGIGKSRLALEFSAMVKNRFADGVAFVPLDAVRDAELLPSEIGLALGIRESAGTTAMERLVQTLANRELLLVLDNFEGLLDGVPLVGKLLASAPRLKIIVTSRAVLRASGEVAYPVPPMQLPPPGSTPTAKEALVFGGVRLFVERARATSPDFVLDEQNVADVIDICRRLDGLPLAIELAAARLRTLSPAALRERMTRLLPLLTGGPRDAPERQRTLRDTIAWSYQQLDEEQRTLFARLAVFDGHTYLEAIESVIGGEGMLDVLADLCDASLVMRIDAEHEVFGMLETLREFARERLLEDERAAEWREVHARYFLVFAAIAAEGLKAAGQRDWLERMRVSDSNMRTALDTFAELGKGQEALRLATALRPFWQRIGSLESGRKRLHQALSQAHDAPPQLRAPALLGEGILAWRQGDQEGARPLLQESLDLGREAGDTATTINALRSLGALAQNRADYAAARTLLTDAVELAQQRDDVESEANTYLSLGNVALDQGLHEEADAHYTRSLELSEQISDTLGYAYALDNLGVSAWHRGDLDRALQLADEVMELYQHLGIESGKANVWHRRCLVALERGRLADAEEHGLRALRVRAAQGEDRAGAFVLYDLARVALARGDHETARQRLRRGLALALPQGAPVIDVLYLEGTAAYLAQVGEDENAYLLLAAAETWRAGMGVPVAPVVLASQRALGASLARRFDAYTRARIEERARDAAPADLTALAARLIAG